MKKPIRLCLVFLFSLSAFLFMRADNGLWAQDRVYQSHTAVEVIPENQSVAPGEKFRAGLMFTMDPEWHIYWINPGDSGMAPALTWTLSEGVREYGMEWPYPVRIESPPLTSFGYQPQTVLFQNFMVESMTAPGDVLVFDLDVQWLACRVDCILGRARLSMRIPVAHQSVSSERFDREARPYLDRVPLELSGEGFSAAFDKSEISLLFPEEGWGEGDLRKADFFPFDDDALDHARVPRFEQRWGRRALVMPVSGLFREKPEARLRGVLVAERVFSDGAHTRSYRLDVPLGKAPALAGAGRASAGGQEMTLWSAVIFAFLGGLLLNVMPCVLPVLSINVLSLIHQSGDARSVIWRKSLFFGLGVMVMFWLLALMLFILKSAGYQIGWGFQFQQPWVLIFLSVLFFVLALYLWGLIRIGTGSLPVKGRTGPRNVMAESFSRGVLMTVCATPCTAPFMGAALGFALTQPFYNAFWIFSSMGAGMAAPYLLLSRFPGLLRYMPKPGEWMNHLKHFFGFVMAAPVIYMADILGRQLGVEAVSGLYLFLLLFATSLWLLKISGPGLTKMAWARKSAASVPAVIGLWVMVFAVTGADSLPQGGGRHPGIRWEDYSHQAFQDALDRGDDVFLNFTAAWCLTCKVNDRVAFRDPRVIEALNRDSLTAFRADWTHYDSEITEGLERYNRSSIPFYVYHFSSEKGGGVYVFPEFITPEIVLKALYRE